MSWSPGSGWWRWSTNAFDALVVPVVPVVAVVAVVGVAFVVAVVAEVAESRDDEVSEECADARPANRATPARDPAASQPVVLRVRRRSAERDGEGMTSLSAPLLGAS